MGDPRTPETTNHCTGLSFLGFIPRSGVSTPAANFPSLVPAPAAHLDLLPAFVQLLGAQRGLGRRHFAFALPQPLPHGPDQLPKFIQLLLAGRCILFSESEKVSESQSSCFALQLPPLECSTVVSLRALLFIIIIIRCCLGTAHAAPAKVGCTPQPAPRRRWPPKPWPAPLLGLLQHHRGTTAANLRQLCTPLFCPGGGSKDFGMTELIHAACSGQLQRGRPGSAAPPPWPQLSSIQPIPEEQGSPRPGATGPSGSPSPTAAASSLHGAGRRQFSAWH